MQNDFKNGRGLNLSDPKYDKDAVNLRTLKREIDSVIIGSGSTLSLFEVGSGNNSAVLKNSNSDAGGDYSSVLGGLSNTIGSNSDYSAILGGLSNTIDDNVYNTVIVGGVNINANKSNSLYTENARLAENSGVIYSAGTDLYNIFATIGSDVFTNGLTYDNANKLTLSKSDSSILEVVIDEFTGLTINGDFEVSGVISSGSTDLSNLFAPIGALTPLPPINQAQIFIGDQTNNPQAVDVIGDVFINHSGQTTIQPQSVTFEKFQNLTGKSVVGNPTPTGGTVEEIPILDAYILSAYNMSLLDNSTNWDINGVYVGPTILDTYQGQAYFNANYWFTAVADNVWIRLIRG